MTAKWEQSREVAHELRNEMSNMVLEAHKLTSEIHLLNEELVREREKNSHLHRRLGDIKDA